MRPLWAALFAVTSAAYVSGMPSAHTALAAEDSSATAASATGGDTAARTNKPKSRKSAPLAQAGQPAPAEPPAPIPTSPGRADPDQVPDPHPTGKTSDEGSTAGSAPGMLAKDAQPEPTAPGGATSQAPATGRSHADRTRAARQSADRNDKSKARLPARRDRSSERPTQ